MIPIKNVKVATNSTVLPPDVVEMAAKQSQLVGSPLRTDKIQNMAKHLRFWYLRKGYIFSSVKGAQLRPETATAEIQVEEPKIAQTPVDIVTCREMIIDKDTGELLTFRQYREKHVTTRNLWHSDRINKNDLNTTYVETKGRTKASRIAKALNLKPGRPFQWHNNRWQKVATSGIFKQILQYSPIRTEDGTIRLQVVVTEPAPRHLEYGVGKSLYTGTWEGELDFEHQNIFGGGETIGFTIRRDASTVTKNAAAPSFRIHYDDDHFGLEGGYNLEIFRDYIGNDDPSSSSKTSEVTHDDSLRDRRGVTFRLRNPIGTTYVANSVASTSFERTSTKSGLHESIGSTKLTLGPFRRAIPIIDGARSSLSTTFTGGSRFATKDSNSKEWSMTNLELLPYSTISATTRQVLPIVSPADRRPIDLALQHTITTSTQNIPRHEARAMGISAEIRGAIPDGSATASITGTAEIRVPVDVSPRLGGGDGSVVFFGDWFCVQKDSKTPFYGKSSIGIGLRKNFAGLPLKYDVCYSSGGKIKAMFGLGPDFDV